MKPEIPAHWAYADSYAFMERVQNGMPPLMICVACNGGVQGKETNEALPETPDEIADSVYGAYKAGASVVHVHARNPDNRTEAATTTEVWCEVNKKIRERCPDIVINNTTGGGLNSTMQDRLACLDARPELASLNLTPDMSRFKLKERKAPLPNPRGPIEFDDCIPFSYRLVNEFARQMKVRGIKPELEVFDLGMVNYARYMIDRGLLTPPYYFNILLGNVGTAQASLLPLAAMLGELPSQSYFSLAGMGRFQAQAVALGAVLGHGIRTGLEDNLWRDAQRTRLARNADLVQTALGIASALGRPVATAAQTRAWLALEPRA